MTTQEKSTPHQRIVKAAKRGTGMRLSADDVQVLATDDAIITRAMSDDEAAGIGEPAVHTLRAP